MADEEKKRRTEMPDPEEFRKIMGIVSTEIPKLLDSISSTMYKQENAENFGKSIATFYKELKAAGMNDEQAYELTQKYMTNFSLGGMIGQVFQGRGRGPDISGDIGEKIKEKMKKAMDEDDE